MTLHERSALHAEAQLILGVVLFALGAWTLTRGLRIRPFVQRRRRWPIPVMPGRVPFGIFLVLASWPSVDFGINNLRFPSNFPRRVEANNDWNTIVPILLGLVFAVWTAVRFWHNDIGYAQPPSPPSVVALERSADAQDRIAAATEELVEQGKNGG